MGLWLKLLPTLAMLALTAAFVASGGAQPLYA
jgi:hypothetical protein